MFYFYRAKDISWQAGGGTVVLPLDFLPALGRRRNRLMIERIQINCDLDITTPGGVSIVSGADFYTFIKQFRVWDSEGDRRLMSGLDIFVNQHESMGANQPNMPTTHAAATTQGDFCEFVINFSQIARVHRRNDYVFPVDDLLNGGGIELTFPQVADIASTGGAITSINSGTYRITIVCSEAHDLQYPVRDIVRSYVNMPSNTEFYVPITNKLVRSVNMYKLTAPGFDAWNSTAAGYRLTCEPYGLNAISCVAINRGYLCEVPHTSTDPVATFEVCPLVFPNLDDKIPDMKRIAGNLLFQFPNGAAASFSFLTNTIAPKSPAVVEATAARYGRSVNAEVKTKGGGDRRPGRWRSLSRYMPSKQVG